MGRKLKAQNVGTSPEGTGVTKQQDVKVSKETHEKHLVGGVVNYHKSLKECKESVGDSKSHEFITQLKQNVMKSSGNLSRYSQKLQTEKEKLDQLSDSLEHEEEKKHIFNAMAELQEKIDLEEQQRSKSEFQLSKLRDLQTNLREKQEEEMKTKDFVSKIRSESENKAAAIFDNNRKKQLELIEANLIEYSKDVTKKLTATKAAQEAARLRILKSKRSQEQARRILEDNRKEAHEKRTKEILKLKQATEAATAEMRGRSQRAAMKEKLKKERQKEEFDKLLLQGKNPYEVFRRRERDAKIKATRARLRMKIKKSEMAIVERTLAFEDYSMKKEQEEAREKAYEDQYRDNLGRDIKEKTISNYIKSKTIGNVDSIDPTGRSFRVQPSQVTVTKTPGFGLGLYKTRPDVVAKIGSKPEHREVEPDWKLVPKKKLFRAIGQSPAGQNDGGMSKSDSTLALLGNDKELPPGLLDRLEVAQNTDEELARQEANKEMELVSQLPDSADLLDKVSIANSQNKKDKYHQRKLSVLEQRMALEARERHKRNLVKDQIVWGKKFTGTAFLAKPEEVMFKDFIVGKVYKRKFILTNVSYTFNSFKVLDLPGDIKNFFEITYEKPGRMSAGLTCSITVTFEPKVNEDIITEIPFLGHTGPFSVPLKCFTRKVKPSLSKQTVQLGTVIIGESICKTLTVENDGALETGFELKIIKSSNENKFADSKELLVDKMSGIVKAYSKEKICFTFSPTIAHQVVDLKYVLCITNPESETKELPFNVKGISTDVPVYVELKEMDMQCCVLGKLYRAKQVVRNRGNVALKMTIQTPRELRDEIEFQPNMAFVQGRDFNGEDGSFDLQLKFRPSRKLTTWCKANITDFDESEGIHTIPVTITVANQVLPVEFKITAKLTTSDLEIVPTAIDFGKCYSNQSVQVPLKVKNLSDLPQRFGFVKLKTQIDVQPDDGFGTLLPNETRELYVTYSPSAAVPETFNLQLRTNMNRIFLIDCKGYGTDPPISFSDSIINFSAQSMNTKVTQSIFITNTSKVEQMFDFVMPETYEEESESWKNHHLKISPLVKSIKPGKTTRIEIEFSPATENVYEAPNSAETDQFNSRFGCSIVYSQCERKKSSEISEQGNDHDINSDVDGNDENNSPETDSHAEDGEAEDNKADCVVNAEEDSTTSMTEFEPWSKHCTWKIPCFVKSKAENENNMLTPPLFIQVRTTTLESQLEADLVDVQFNQVSVGHSKVITVRLKNLGSHSSPLYCTGLNALGPFSSINAMRPLEPGTSLPVLIKFEPRYNLKYCETFSFESLSGKVDIRLTGEGVSPELSLEAVEGDDINPNELNFGHIAAGESVDKQFKIRNCSVFPVEYIVVPVAITCANFNGTEMFSIFPHEASIPAGECVTITARFSPDHEQNTEFEARFKVDVPNQLGEHNIRMFGHCWDMPMYLIGGEAEANDKVNNPLSLPGSGLARKQKIILNIDGSVSSSVKVSIGSCSSKTSGNFEFLGVDSDRVSIDVMKGSLKPGESQEVTLTWNEDNNDSNKTKEEFKCLLTANEYPDKIIDLVLIKREN